MKNIFDKHDTDGMIERISKLAADTKPQWGKMTSAQMFAHCNVSYEFVYDNKHPKPNAVKRFVISLLIKSTVVGDKPYKKNSPTAPAFKMTVAKNFEEEKQRLIEYIRKTQQLGEKHFDGKESHSFGALSATQWNAMFYKHLNHHLTQFGV